MMVLLDDAHTQNRIARKHLIRNVPGFVSVGHVLVLLGFVATVLSVTLAIDWDRSQLQFFGHRLGWYFPHCPGFASTANLIQGDYGTPRLCYFPITEEHTTCNSHVIFL
jgi:hypothetical protein